MVGISYSIFTSVYSAMNGSFSRYVAFLVLSMRCGSRNSGRVSTVLVKLFQSVGLTDLKCYYQIG